MRRLHLSFMSVCGDYVAADAEGDSPAFASGGFDAEFYLAVYFAVLARGVEFYFDFSRFAGLNGLGGVFGLGASAGGRGGEDGHGYGALVGHHEHGLDGCGGLADGAEIEDSLVELDFGPGAECGESRGEDEGESDCESSEGHFLWILSK